MSFRVRATACDTCIYRQDMHFDLAKLEGQVQDELGYFEGWRECHHPPEGETEGVCCRGYWNRHKDDFPVGQVAQRLGQIVFVALAMAALVPPAVAQPRPGAEWKCVVEWRAECPASHPVPHSTTEGVCVDAAGNEAAMDTAASRPQWVNMEQVVSVIGNQHELAGGQTRNWERIADADCD